MRNIIQIATCESAIGPRLYALCDDGTVWEFFIGEWRQVTKIPQDKKEVTYEIGSDLG